MKEQLQSLAGKSNEIFFHVFAVIMAFISPIKYLLLLVGFAIMADTIIAIVAARHRKEKITSRKLSRVINKQFLYLGTIIFFYCLDKHLMGEFVSIFTEIDLFMTKIVAIVLTSIELFSVNETLINTYNFSIWKKVKQLIFASKTIKEEISDLSNLKVNKKFNERED